MPAARSSRNELFNLEMEMDLRAAEIEDVLGRALETVMTDSNSGYDGIAEMNTDDQAILNK